MSDPAASVSQDSVTFTQELPADGYVNAVSWSPDGLRLAVLSNFGGTVTVWQTDDWKVVNKFSRNGGAYSQNSLTFMQDGSLITAAPIGETTDTRTGNSTIFGLTQWDPDTGQPLHYIPNPNTYSLGLKDKIGTVDTFVRSSDDKFVIGISKSSVLVFRTSDWSIIRQIMVPPAPTHPDYPASVAISTDGSLLGIGTGFGHVHLYSQNDEAPLRSFVAYPGDALHYCESISFSPDGQLLATGRGGMSVGEVDDGWTRIWRVNDCANVARLTGGVGSVRTMAWSRDGRSLAVGDDRSIRFWQTRHFPPSLYMKNTFREGCFSLAFSPNDALAAASGSKVKIY